MVNGGRTAYSRHLEDSEAITMYRLLFALVFAGSWPLTSHAAEPTGAAAMFIVNENLAKTQVAMTVAGGRIVYQAGQ